MGAGGKGSGRHGIDGRGVPVSSKRMTERTKKTHEILTKSAAREGYRKSAEPSERMSHGGRNGARNSARLPIAAPQMAPSNTVTHVLYVVPDASCKGGGELSSDRAW